MVCIYRNQSFRLYGKYAKHAHDGMSYGKNPVGTETLGVLGGNDSRLGRNGSRSYGQDLSAVQLAKQGEIDRWRRR